MNGNANEVAAAASKRIDGNEIKDDKTQGNLSFRNQLDICKTNKFNIAQLFWIWKKK